MNKSNDLNIKIKQYVICSRHRDVKIMSNHLIRSLHVLCFGGEALEGVLREGMGFFS